MEEEMRMIQALKVNLIGLALAMNFVFPVSSQAAETRHEPYRISPDDALEIVVADHPDLNVATTVIQDGTITVPLLGSVEVAGLTPDEAKTKLERLYDSRFVANPVIRVNLVKARSRRFFVYGEVKAPGAYPLTDGLTVIKAIATAGGFTDYASKWRVRVLRNADGKSKTIRVNVWKIEKGRVDKDIPLEPEDVIIVPERWF